MMKLGYDRDTWETDAIKEPIKYSQKTHPSVLISGSSGSGKSVMLNYVMYHLEPCNLFFFDFKGDYKELEGCGHYKSGDEVIDALEKYHEDFQSVRRGELEQHMQHILVIDEYPALISYLDKKSAERMKAIIQSLLMLGRGVRKGFGTWICCQRSDAALFPGGARNNFMITVHMGRATPEDWKMNFAGLEKPNRDYKCGQGFVWADGYEPRNLLVPRITYLDKLTEGVKNHLDGIW